MMAYIIDMLPYTITVPGEYRLASDLVAASNGIVINTSGVTIDLNGYTISGSRSPKNEFFGISSFNYDHINIVNGNIRGFQYGIYLSDLVDHVSSGAQLTGAGLHIENVNISESTFCGVRIEGQNSIVRNNTISEIGGVAIYPDSYAFGIESFGFNDTIAGNTIRDVRGSGINDLGEGIGISVSYYGDGTVISNNFIVNTTSEIDTNYLNWAGGSRSTWAIWIGGDVPTYNIVTDGNHIENYIYGISYKRTASGEFRNNNVNNTVVPYYRPYDTDGTRVVDGGDNTSSIQAKQLAWGRHTPGQIESVEDIYLSPLPRTPELLFYPLHNPTNGDETITGFVGQDTMVDYWASPSAVAVDLLHGSVSGGGGNDSLVDIHGAQGSRFDDILIGDDSRNLLSGASGSDVLYGGAGDDYLFGDDAASHVAPMGRDSLYGEDGNDRLYGGLQADLLDGGAGFDYAQYDYMYYGNLQVSLSDPAINTGAAAGDIFVDIEGLVLGAGNDYVWGNDSGNYLYGLSGNDVLYGNGGNDNIHAGDGDDMLIGGADADYLDGGLGNDVFEFRAGDGNDYIADFQGGDGIIDRIDLRGMFSSFINVLAASIQVGSDVLITLPDGSVLTVANFYLGNLSPDDVLL